MMMLESPSIHMFNMLTTDSMIFVICITNINHHICETRTIVAAVEPSTFSQAVMFNTVIDAMVGFHGETKRIGTRAAG